MFRHKNKLVVGLTLVLLAAGFVFGASAVSADEPVTVEPVVLSDGTIVEAVTSPGIEGLILTAVMTGVATDEVLSCPEYCGDMNCVFPVSSSRVLPANEPIRWWAGCKCVPFEGPDPQQVSCECDEQSFCGRTRGADFLGWIYAGGQFYPGGFVGKYGGASDLTIARFRLAGVPVGEVKKVTVSFDGVQTDGLAGCGDDAVFKIDLLSYALSYTWGKWGYWNYVQPYVVLGPIYEVTAQYLRAVTDEDGRVPTIGFRLSNEQVSGLEEAIARAHRTSPCWNPNWSLFVRVTLANPPEVGDCVLKFRNVLLTIPE